MGRSETNVAHFYDDRKDRAPRWEDVGGFNAHLLMEMRSAMIDVESDVRPLLTVQDAMYEWFRRHPAFEFPDDEIG
jgi:hypothetical protein